MTNFSFANADDAKELRNLFVEVVDGLSVYCLSMRKEQLQTYTEDFFVRKISEDPLSVTKAVIDGELAGFISSTNQTGPAWIDWVITANVFRRRGVADGLVKSMISSAHLRGVHKIWCDTRSQNYPAIAVFERLGFTRKCELISHWHKEDYLIWEKFI